MPQQRRLERDLEHELDVVRRRIELATWFDAAAARQRERERRPWPWELRWIARTERDLVVMRLARLGYTNKRIGARVGLHPTTVSRIVQRELRAVRGFQCLDGRDART